MRRALLVGLLALLALDASSFAAGVSAPGVVTGRVWRDAKTIQCVKAPCLEPAPAVRMTFWRPGIRRILTTNREGRYSVSLPPGVYRVTGPGLVRQGLVDLNAIRVRSGARLVVNFRVGKPDDKPDDPSNE